MIIVPLGKEIEKLLIEIDPAQPDQKFLSTFQLKTFPKAYAVAGDHETAIKQIKAALKKYSSDPNKEHVSSGHAFNMLAAYNFELGNYDEMVEFGSKCLAYADKNLGPSAADTIALMKSLQSVYTTAGKLEEANKIADRLKLVEQAKLQQSAAANKQRQQIQSQIEPAKAEYKKQAEANQGVHFESATRLMNAYLQSGMGSEALVIAREQQQKSIAAHGIESLYALRANSNLVAVTKLTQSASASVFCRRSFVDQVISKLGS